MGYITTRLAALSAAVRAIAAALPMDQSAKVARALREVVDERIAERGPALTARVDAAIPAEVGGRLGALGPAWGMNGGQWRPTLENTKWRGS